MDETTVKMYKNEDLKIDKKRENEEQTLIRELGIKIYTPELDTGAGRYNAVYHPPISEINMQALLKIVDELKIIRKSIDELKNRVESIEIERDIEEQHKMEQRERE